MRFPFCLMTGIAPVAALLIFSVADAAAMPEYDNGWQDIACLNSKAPSTCRALDIETNGDALLPEALSRTTEYPHYRPPQAASYPSAKPPSSEKKPEADKDRKYAQHERKTMEWAIAGFSQPAV